MDIDASSGTVTATCETDLDSFSDAYYSAQVHCGVYDTNNNLIAYGTAIDSSGQGFVQVVLTFTGVPGMTYSAIGSHVGLVTFNEEAYSQDDQPIYLGFDDAYNFSSFAESAQTYPDTYDWFGPGPDTVTRSHTIHTGNSTATAIRYYTQSELQSLIANAQAILSPHCDAVFSKIIVPTYTNANFFNSLRVTAFLQYPKGVAAPPDIGSVLDEPIADTLINQSGRPIRLFANFYPPASGFPAGYRESILTHEGIHHYTGWLDAHDPTRPQIPDFITQFYSSGYRNTSGTTADFSDWISAGCTQSP